MPEGRLINAWDVTQEVRRRLGPVKVIWSRNEAHWRFSDGHRPPRRWVTFDEAATAHGVTGPWVTPRSRLTTGQVWFPQTAIDRLAEPLRWDRTGKPVAFVEGVPCHAQVSDGSGWHYATCGRLAIAKGRPDFCKEDVPICGIHANGLARRAATDAKVSADITAMFERTDADARHRRASADWVARLAEHGVYAEASGGSSLRVKVKPEELYGLLTELAGVLRDVGAEWPETPARREETS